MLVVEGLRGDLWRVEVLFKRSRMQRRVGCRGARCRGVVLVEDRGDVKEDNCGEERWRW